MAWDRVAPQWGRLHAAVDGQRSLVLFAQSSANPPSCSCLKEKSGHAGAEPQALVWGCSSHSATLIAGQKNGEQSCSYGG